MVNQNGEFPMDQRVSIRLHISEKKQAQDLPFTYREIFMYGLNLLSDELVRLKFEIGELEESIHNDESLLNADKALLAAKKNRLRMIAPQELDESTLKSMLEESARDYAQSIFDRRGENALKSIENELAKSSIKNEGRELGYDGNKFLVEVKNFLEELCQTQLSDISDNRL